MVMVTWGSIYIFFKVIMDPYFLFYIWYVMCIDLTCWLILKQGNVGLIFTKGDLKEVREEVAKYKVWLFKL